MNGRAICLLCASLLFISVASLSQQPVLEIEDPLVLQLGAEGEPYEALGIGQHGGTVHLAVPSDPTGWNPVVTVETAILNLCYLFLHGLISTHVTTGELYGELARSWEVSEDGLEITFHLRCGLVWSDGAPFTAEDVLFTYNDLHFNEDVRSGLRGALRLPCGEFPAIEKADEFTIVVRSPEVFRPLLNQFTAHIMPKHKLAQFVHKLNPDAPPGTFNETWKLDTPIQEVVGLGPFLLDRYVPGQQVVLRRNPTYYHFDQAGNRLPYVDEVVYTINEGADVSLLQFLNGQIDAIHARGENLAYLMSEASRAGFTVFRSGGGWTTECLVLNQDAHDEQLRTLFRRLEFRQAIAHSIDKASIIDLVWLGEAIPIWSPVSVRSPFYAGREAYGGPITERFAVTYGFDLVKADALLGECGIIDTNGDGIREFSDGTPVRWTLTSNSEATSRGDAAAIIAADLQKVGIEVVLDAVDWTAYVTNVLSGAYEAAMIGLGGGEDPHSGMNVYASGGGTHFWHYSAASGDAYPFEARIDQLFELGASTFDLEEAFEYYREFQTLFAREDLGVIFLVSPGDAFAVYNHFGNAEVFSLAGGYSGYGILQLIYLL